MSKIKICGITNLEDALCVRDAGSDYIGFIFYKNSPRYVDPEIVGQINEQLDGVIKVGVFVNEDVEKINEIKQIAGLDLVQLHGDENLEYCNNFNLKEIIKVIRVKDHIDDLDEILSVGFKNILLDTYSEKEYGGTGKVFNWSAAKEVVEKFNGNVFLSGGLNLDNIKQAVQEVNPFVVDVSSGVEVEPGKKDCEKVRSIISIVKSL